MEADIYLVDGSLVADLTGKAEIGCGCVCAAASVREIEGGYELSSIIFDEGDPARIPEDAEIVAKDAYIRVRK